GGARISVLAISCTRSGAVSATALTLARRPRGANRHPQPLLINTVLGCDCCYMHHLVRSDMTVADADVWNLANSVSATAPVMAPRRALASRDHNALIDAPFAEPLVDAVGVDFFTRLARGDLDLPQADYRGPWGIARLRDMIAIRTRFYD